MNRTTTFLTTLLIVLYGLSATELLAQPTLTNQPSDPVALPGGPVTCSVSASGAGPFTYQWQFKGSNLPAANWFDEGAPVNGHGAHCPRTCPSAPNRESSSAGISPTKPRKSVPNKI